MKCPNCGGPCSNEDRFCAYCKTKLDPYATIPEAKQEIHIHYHQEHRPEPEVLLEKIYVPKEKTSSKNRIVALLLCVFLGIFGAHKFYLGKFGVGLVYIFTYGLFGIGWLIDLVTLIAGNPLDKKGLRLTWR